MNEHLLRDQYRQTNPGKLGHIDAVREANYLYRARNSMIR